MILVKLEGGSRGVVPLACPVMSLLVVRDRGDHLGKLGQPSGQQGPRAAVTLQRLQEGAERELLFLLAWACRQALLR